MEHKLHLALNHQSYAMLQWLKAAMDATSDSEVIRRALQATELFEPFDLSDAEAWPCLSSTPPRHLYVRISERQKEVLDSECAVSGRTYGEQIRLGLRLLVQFTRDRERILKQVQATGKVVLPAPT